MKPAKCSLCEILEGSDLCHERLMKYREHLICSWCKTEWRKKEKMAGREIGFLELKWWGEKISKCEGSRVRLLRR